MTNALIIDTSTDMLSISFGSSPENVQHVSMPQHSNQSENILPAIDEVIKSAGANIKDVDVIGVGVGPGMFTGVRVGVTCAHSLAHALNAKLVYVSSLEIAALSTLQGPTLQMTEGDVWVAKDARRKELYAACYKSSLQGPTLQDLQEVDGVKIATCLVRIEAEHLVSPSNFVEKVRDGEILIIDSLETYPELGELTNLSNLYTSSIDTSKSIGIVLNAYESGLVADIFDPKVLYLRKSDAELSWGKAGQ